MSKRTEQIGSVVQHTVATSLREHLSTMAVVTVTGVEISPDLKHGIIWISVIGGEPEDVLTQILEVKRYIQSDVNKQMKSKFTPRLQYKLDHGGEYANHISQVLKNL